MKDDKYVLSSRLYSLLNDQLQHWNTEAERYKTLIDSLKVISIYCTCFFAIYAGFISFKLFLQADKPQVTRREKEVNAKLGSTDAARICIDVSESGIEELEHQLQKCIIEKNDLAVKMEEVIEDLGEII